MSRGKTRTRHREFGKSSGIAGIMSGIERDPEEPE
jgi:hypothetical protein